MDGFFSKASVVRIKRHFNGNKTNAKPSVMRFKSAFSNHDDMLQMHLRRLGLSELSEYLAWFQFDRFKLSVICHGGFSTVYKGIYTWPENDNTHEAREAVFALKEFDRSMVVLNVHLFNQSRGLCPTIKIYGITHDEKTNKYMMVTQCGDYSLDTWQTTTDGLWYKLVTSWRLLSLYLNKIHRMGVLHQDLHPGNIVYVKGVPQFIDTGLSTLRTQHSKTKRGVFGRLAYLPPEIFKGQPYTTSSEVYCLGTLFWQMVTGVPPRGTASDRRRDGLREDSIPGMPKPLMDLIRDCWYEVPARRPTMSQILKRCRALMAMDVVLSPIPESTKVFVAQRRAEHAMSLEQQEDGGFVFVESESSEYNSRFFSSYDLRAVNRVAPMKSAPKIPRPIPTHSGKKPEIQT
ncbi:kinase-like domain-containing protein [Endogone sp. FLAS-F59071]|nr:kinase-like domain-containing protein [Endogone sp. FLAS-F59071]|eukprot:RUS14730.1 kinase-like domain-containing protein [Endogone sp. FLAS-F59071]